MIIWGAPFGNESFRENAASVKNLSATNDSLWILLQDGSLHRYLESDDRSSDDLKNVTDMCAYGEQIFTIVKGGNLFALGDNESGLTEEENVGRPWVWLPLLQSPKSTVIIVQVACGHSHTLMLAKYGDMYSMGDNCHGQLGLQKKDATVVSKPQVIDSLEGVPIRQIAAGVWHSFCITVSGRVFAWGRNDFGQLGLGDSTAERSFPTLLKSFADYFVSFISAGEFHTALLTKTGALYTIGQGSYGQLGHGDTCANERAPKIVKELEDSQVTQVSCGRHHTIAFVPGCAQVFVFGSNDAGQLGFPPEKKKITVPAIAEGPWQEQVEIRVRKVYAIGDRSLILLAKSEEESSDCLLIERNRQIATLDEDFCTSIEKMCDDHTVMLEDLRSIAGSQSCLSGSFSDDDGMVSNAFHGVDLPKARELISRLCQSNNPEVKEILLLALEQLVQKLSSDPADIESLRLYILLPLIMDSLVHSALVEFADKTLENAFFPFLKKMLKLFKGPLATTKRWLQRVDQETFSIMLTLSKFSINRIVMGRESKLEQSYMELPLKYLKLLFESNEISKVVKCKEFYLSYLQNELLKFHFEKWRQKLETNIELSDPTPSLCEFPFLLNATAKCYLLELNMKRRVAQSRRSLPFWNVDLVVVPPVLLKIDRKDVVSSAITQLKPFSNLQRPLQVKFLNEEGIDDVVHGDGALRKEFFMLFFEEIPKFDIFKEDETSKFLWFHRQSGSEGIYKVLGKLCGLALCNSIIVNLNFPLALYKKLRNEKTNFDDFKEINPEFGNSLKQVLDFEEEEDLTVEDTFDLTFITPDGSPLKKGGEDIPVTAANREEYVKLYLDYFFNKSIQSQFDAFRDGFLQACDHEMLQLFRPEELMEMINGIEEYDWEILKQVTQYVPLKSFDCESGRFGSLHPIIKWFWEVLFSFSKEEKDKFLVFLTGSNKIPLTGLHMTIVQRNECDEWMPTADVCYNKLNLHSYSSQEILEERLKLAIQCDGFHRV